MEPEELLAAFDATGRRLTAKPRSAIHRDRDWHWLVFVWAVRREAHRRLRLLLQVRGRPGDPHLGSLDAPAGGHVAARETHLQAACREFGEEAGVALGEGELLYLGERRLENPDGICQRAFEHLYLCRRSLDLQELRFSVETSGFVDVDLEEFADLLEGRGKAIPALARWVAEPEQIQRADVDRAWLSSYAEPILDGFRWSLHAIRAHFGEVRTP